MQQDQEFVEYIVKSIVDSPDEVTTERSVDEMGVLITLTVSPADMGKIIGKEGRTAKALRTLLRVLGAKNNARVNLKITEPDGGEGGTEQRQDHSNNSEPEETISSEPSAEPSAEPLTENATEIL